MYFCLGRTADITVHGKLKDGLHKELCRASGNNCGGTYVDSAFIQVFAKVFGGPLMNLIKIEIPLAFNDIFREFEAVKRNLKQKKIINNKLIMSFQRAVLDEMCNKHLGDQFRSVSTQRSTKIPVQQIKNRFLAHQEIIRRCF